MDSRTIRDFSVSADIWPTVDKWMSTEGFRLIDDRGAKRTFQKGYGLMILPTKVEITQTDGSVHLEAWIQSNIITRVMTVFLTPIEIKLDSGGFIFAIPRSIARDSVNRLLILLGQPLIT